MRSLLLAILMIFLQACVTKPVNFSQEKQEGQWEAKAQIRDLKKNSSNTLSLDVMAYKNRALRMEVSGVMGIQVASLLLKNKKILLLMHTQKKAMMGEASRELLKSNLKVDIDPDWLYAMFFDEAIAAWTCRGQPVEFCESSDGEKISWTERDGERKRIKITSGKFEMQILVKSFQTKVQSPETTFKISIPESYKRYKLD